MTITVSTLLNWDPAGLASCANQLVGMSGQVGELAVKFTGHSDLAQYWSGQAQSAEAQVADDVGRSIEWLSRTGTDAATAVRSAISDIDNAQGELRSVKAAVAAIGPGYVMDEDGSVTGPPFVPLADPVLNQSAVIEHKTNGEDGANLGLRAKAALQLATDADARAAIALRTALSARPSSHDWVQQQAAFLAGTGPQPTDPPDWTAVDPGAAAGDASLAATGTTTVVSQGWGEPLGGTQYRIQLTGANSAAALAALGQVGDNYAWGGGNGTGPGLGIVYQDATTRIDDSQVRGFDCSGLVQYAYMKATGKNIGGETHSQFPNLPDATGEHQQGDLIYFGDPTTHDPNSVYHVAMYLGDGLIVHAPESGDEVKVQSLTDFYTQTEGGESAVLAWKRP